MSDFIDIGSIAKPQGIKGEVKLSPYHGEGERLKKLKRIFIDGVSYSVLSVKAGGDTVIFGLSEVTDRNQAELLRGKRVTVERDDLPPLDRGVFYVKDVLNCKLYQDEELVGEVIEVTSLRTDVYTVRLENGKIMRFPFLKKLNPIVDILNKKITVDKKILGEVSCYED